MRKRVYALFCGIAVLFAGIGVRLLMLSQGTLETASVRQSSRVQTIAVSRGTIYDRYLQPLVNRYYGVVASVAPFAPMLEALSEHGEYEARRYVEALSATGDRVVVPLTSWLPPTQGIAQVWAPDRYGSDTPSCHLVGYINGYSEGVSGAEMVFDEVLSRYSGEATVSYRVDALGRATIEGAGQVANTLQKAKGGVVLSLDAHVQAVVQATASEMIERGAVLVSSAESGELLASVSLPLYDPDHVEEALSRVDSPLLDRTRINYDLGSVFKLITATAALESGVPPDRVYICHGSCVLGNAVIRCHNPLGDGALNMTEAMSRSCNCYFIELARDVGAQALCRVAERAGFSSSLTLTEGLETSRALLPSEDSLSAEAALGNFAIGQGMLMATPHHVQALMTAVVRDGMWSVPSVYIGEVDEHGAIVDEASPASEKRLMSTETAATLRRMLETVVESGTGTAAMPQSGSAAGKTGTAETGWEIDGEAVVQSWFSGYYPADDPQFIITVLSENGGVNGQGAAPLFRTLCEELSRAGLVEKDGLTP